MIIKNLSCFILKPGRKLNCLLFVRSFHVNVIARTNRKWIINSNDTNVPVEESRAFTVMTYNILAQRHLHNHQDLYEENNPKSLEWPNRLKLIQQEIEEISPEILCLQEVEIDRLHEIATELKALNFTEPLYKKRSGHQSDGCAIFFNRNKFRLIEQYPIDYFRPGVRVNIKIQFQKVKSLKLCLIFRPSIVATLQWLQSFVLNHRMKSNYWWRQRIYYLIRGEQTFD